MTDRTTVDRVADKTMFTRTSRVRRVTGRMLAVVLSASLASGCRTFRPLPPSSGALQESIRPGDDLRVVMRDGTELYLTVTAITSETLDGELVHGLLQGRRLVTLRLADIASVQRSEVSAGKTAAGAVIGVVVAVAVAGFAFLLWVVTQIPAERDAPGRHAVPQSPRR